MAVLVTGSWCKDTVLVEQAVTAEADAVHAIAEVHSYFHATSSVPILRCPLPDTTH